MIYINKVSVVSVKVSVIEEAPMALPFLPSSAEILRIQMNLYQIH